MGGVGRTVVATVSCACMKKTQMAKKQHMFYIAMPVYEYHSVRLLSPMQAYVVFAC